ncbi:MAG TPA: hypothetical protein VF211_10390 [Burkholderiales bacterium]
MPFAQVGELQVAEDIRFQRREWLAERLGWVVMTAAVFAALAGLVGDGPASNAVAASPGGRLAVEYQRFAHRQAPTELRVRYGEGSAQQGRIRLALDSQYVGKLKIERVQPEPEKIELAGGRYVYVFPAGDGPGQVTFVVQMEAFGRVAGGVALGEERVALSQIVYP